MPIDEATAKVMDQNFALNNQRLALIGEQQASTAKNVQEHTQLGHLNAHALITAAALRYGATDGIAATRIQLAGSGSPPGFPPGSGNIAPVT
jgi:hypothetical protein